MDEVHGFYSWNMLLMITYRWSCVETWFTFVLFTSIFKHTGDALLKNSFALSALYICLLMLKICYQPLNKGKSCNKAKHLHTAPPDFSDLEYSTAVSLLY